MRWIIWTIGWYLAIEYIGYIHREDEKHSKDVEFLALVIKFGIWVIGMIHFW